MLQHPLPWEALPLSRLWTGQVPDISHFLHFLSGNLSITKWMKMNLTTDFHLNLMKKEDTGLALLTTRVITLHEDPY